MPLSGLKLSQGMKGDEVKLLHFALGQLGHFIPDDELNSSFFGKGTAQAVAVFQEKRGLKPTGVIDEATAKQINTEVDALQPQPKPDGNEPKKDDQQPADGKPQSFIVRGQVRQADGTAIIGSIVRAFDKDLPSLRRKEEELGKAITDKDGLYEITYTAEQFRRAEKKSADLIVRVFNQEPSPLASSPIIFNAGPEETVDLVVDGAMLSEYERYLEELAPLLENIRIADMTEEDITFLNGDTGIDKQHLSFLVIAVRLADKDRRAEVFYGLFRQSMPTDLTALLAQGTERHRVALQNSLRDNIIPAKLRDSLESILTRLSSLHVQETLENSKVPGKASLGQLLDSSVFAIPKSTQEKFVEAYIKHEGPIDDFWKSLGKDPEFQKDGRVEELKFTIELGALTENHLPLIVELQKLRRDKAVQFPRDLARLDKDGWLGLIKKQAGFPPDTPGKNNDEKARNFAEKLARAVEEKFPTAVIASRVEKSSLAGKGDLVKFFNNNPDFEFGTTHIEGYLQKNSDKALAGISDKEGLKQQLKGMQRVFKLTPRYDEIQTLLHDGIHSAQTIARMGEPFVEKYGKQFGESRAKEIANKAQQSYAIALTVYTQFAMPFHRTSTAVMNRQPAEVAGLPEWRSLFGSLDLCDCQHCCSVYSPAAYLVDILSFLRDRAANVKRLSVKEVLFNRRPDIGEIELTCENTNTLLPYVDLVNEVLEDAIAATNGGSRVSHATYQTTGTAEELRANPEHVNPAAYDKLRDAVYPWSLPLNLWTEEARVYLNHLGVQRHELMETFFSGDRSSALRDTAIAQEHLGLTAKEAQIITGAASEPAWVFWGLLKTGNNISDPTDSTAPAATGTWDVVLRRVSIFLKQSNLNFTELKELLDTRFINPQTRSPLRIESTDANDPETCNLSKLEIRNLGPEALDRIHRFVRLWRKLGWDMRDVDRAITALRPGNLSGPFLTQVAHIHRLRARCNVSVATALSWWANIDTAAYHKDDGPPIPSLYEQLFLNKAVSNPPPSIFALSPDRRELSDATQKIRAHRSELLAALGISAVDLSLLLEREFNDAAGATIDLNLGNLSRLYRNVSLSRALNQSVEDFLAMKKLTGINPFNAPEDTLRFVEALEKIRASTFSITELDYLLRHKARDASSMAPAEKSIGVMLLQLRRTLDEDLVVQTLGDILKVEAAMIKPLLTRWINSRANATQRAITDFLALATLVRGREIEPIKRTEAPAAFETFTLLHKIAIIISRFGITPQELERIFAGEAAENWLDLKALPVDGVPITDERAGSLFRQWERLLDFIMVRDSLPRRETRLIEVFPVTTLDDARQKLIAATSWDAAIVGQLIDGFSLTVNDLKNGAWLARLRDCLTLARRVGAPVTQLFDWARNEPGLNQALEIKNAVKAKYDAAGWQQVAKPLRDVLREKQRAALVSYLIAHPHLDADHKPLWKDANGLYAHFLIDVEMSACQMTSRIKQAISSVQLFVQRCLMNLEPEIRANAEQDTTWLQWKWMKNYRVWEANRMVFLYPENWIEPELRDDKSSFYKDLENELLQNEVTADTAETAFLSYLDQLDAVARLDICGMYYQEERDGRGNKTVDVLHVFGRTRGTPHIYYYRRRVDSSYWTPWEKVEVDIQGDHLIPVVWERRVHVFWPIFTEKTLKREASAEQRAVSELDRTIAVTIRELARTPLPQIIEVVQRLGRLVNDRRTQSRSEQTSASENHRLIEATIARLESQSDSFGVLAAVIGHLRVIRDNLPQTINTNSTAAPEPDKYWEIQLAWSELKNGKWSPKKVTKEAAPSDPEPFIRWLRGTITQPKKQDFFFRSDIVANNNLVITGYWPIVTQPTDPVYEWAPFQFLFAGCHGEVRIHQLEQRFRPIIPFGSHVEFMTLAEDGRLDHPLRLIAGDLRQDIRTLEHTPVKPDTNYFKIVYPHQFSQFLAQTPFFYQDDSRTFYVVPTYVAEDLGQALGPALRLLDTFRFETFYHPYVCEFIKQLNRVGIDGLLNPAPVGESSALRRQQIRSEYFEKEYAPTGWVHKDYPVDDVDFRFGGSYAQYNWELFFHAPLLIADRLSKNQRFEEAQKWFHYIFDPTDSSRYDRPQRYWKTRPFFEREREGYQREQIENLLRQVNSGDGELVRQVEEWRKHPFNPHLIARLRTTAYQKAVVLKYLDNLIAWGDQLFRRDTIESINEATQLYILAAEILGERPQKFLRRDGRQVHTYNTLEPDLDRFSNALVQLENLVPAPRTGTLLAPHERQPLPQLPFYFCIPRNDKLVGYWDTVADRLFKIRHCMNIEGVVRQLPLFEPPIDPALLVRAVAAGIDLSSLLNDISAALPHHRFSVMAQKATELCNEVRTLGAALLSALEKRDAEALALMRSGHEVSLLKAVREVRQRQVTEAQAALEALRKTRLVTEHRKQFYHERQLSSRVVPGNFITVPTPLNAQETESLQLLKAARDYQLAAGITEIAAGVSHALPDFLGPVAKWGGSHAGHALQAATRVLNLIASEHTYLGTNASTMSTYIRRAEEWRFQEEQAARELDQVDKQIAAAEIRLAIAEKELENHEKQIENAREVDDYMRGKFTNRELYDWMVGQISSIYFQSYQLAYDVARRAERAYRFELGLQDSNFIQFGYWDSLKKGLLAGERLHYDLKRMEVAFLDQNKRDYEITKHISLAILDPIALLTLKETGECEVNLPETLFDMDYPGHYMRRIKSVSLTIPCVAGPYTSINCTLTLLANSIRKNTSRDGTYARNTGVDDPRFVDNLGAIQSIVTSGAQNDSGVFELNFRDERYLPFEGLGAISRWRIEMPGECNRFDFNTISDVVVHLKYTARDGGDALKRDAKSAVVSLRPRTGVRLFSARHEFVNDWHRFFHPDETATAQTLNLDLKPEQFPFHFHGQRITINQVELFLNLKDGSDPSLTALRVSLTPPGDTEGTGVFTSSEDLFGGLPHLVFPVTTRVPPTFTRPLTLPATVTLTASELNADAIEDMFIVCHYSAD